LCGLSGDAMVAEELPKDADESGVW
jgi:hypothetical protein